MTARQPIGPALKATRVVAILRGRSGAHLPAVSAALLAAGVRCLELTSNTPGALEELARLAGAAGGEVELGLGTARTPAHVEAAAKAGATYVVSPGTDPAIGARAAELGLAWYPGAATPTEIATAWDLGATAVKLFPAGSLGGPRYLREVRGPLDDIPLVPTGGVALDDIAAYLAAGAVAVGLGGPLLADALDGGDLAALATRAERALAAAAEGRA